MAIYGNMVRKLVYIPFVPPCTGAYSEIKLGGGGEVGAKPSWGAIRHFWEIFPLFAHYSFQKGQKLENR